MKLKNACANILVFLLAFPVSLALIELVMRGMRVAISTYSLIKDGDSNLYTSIYRSDPLTGWSPRPLLQKRNVKKTSHKGRQYLASYATDQYGIRSIFGNDPRSSAPKQRKILVIGDSYTGDFYSSNEDAWFAMIQKMHPDRYRVYAYGIGGSGTTQEYLAFQRLQKIVKPDILIIQFCTNDITNDHMPSSYFSIVRNQDLVRPYLVNGQYKYRGDAWAILYRFFNQHSYLFRFLDSKVQVLQHRLHSGYSTNPEKSHALLPDAVTKWKGIYRAFVRYAFASGVRQVWSVSCGSRLQKGNELVTEWVKASSELGVSVFEEFADSAFRSRQAGADIFYRDGSHFNDRGNQLAGRALVREMEQRGYLAP